MNTQYYNGFHVGFTGTQIGMTSEQLRSLRLLLTDFRGSLPMPALFHHGDCIGADAEAHTIALDAGYGVIVHPPTNPVKRAYCPTTLVIRPPAPYLERNHHIVDDSDVLIAAPKEDSEIIRSGTWSTVRYAQKKASRLKFPSTDRLRRVPVEKVPCIIILKPHHELTEDEVNQHIRDVRAELLRRDRHLNYFIDVACCLDDSMDYEYINRKILDEP